MTKTKKQVSADFRYDTGEARIPWPAVGESLREEDTLAFVKFLCQPDTKKTTRYNAQLKRVKAVNGGVNVSHLAEQQCTTQWVYSRDRPGCQFQF